MALFKKHNVLTPEEKELFRLNEKSANAYLVQCLNITAILMAIILVLFNIGVFEIYDAVTLNVSFGSEIALLLLPNFLIRRPKLANSTYFKYYLLFTFVLVIAAVNVALPRHGILAWACCIMVACHYYSPFVARITYLNCLIFMFGALALGMLAGEWDCNILNGNWGQLNGIDESLYASWDGRLAWLDFLEEQGEDRRFAAFVFYGVPRALILTLILIIGDMLSHRTWRLLKEKSDASATQERLNTELSVATDLQVNMLPHKFTFEGHNEFDLYGSMKAAKEVGGDFYDFSLIGDRHLVMVIADVSGKGIPAAIFTMTTKTVLKCLSYNGLSTEEIMNITNHRISSNNPAGLFVTCWYGILDLETGDLHYTNAGHNAPYLRHANGTLEPLRGKRGLALAAMDDVKYKGNMAHLEPGDTLFMYTDGITEALSEEIEQFGEARLEAALVQEQPTAQAYIETVQSACDAFVGEAAQFDDMTMLCLRYRAKRAYVERTVPAITENLTALTDELDEYLEGFGVSMKAQTAINIALDEVYANVCMYAYGQNTGEVTVRYIVEEGIFTLSVIDQGYAYNPLAKADPNVKATADERGVGGLGVYMVKKLMDEVAYEYVDGSNILTMKKHV